MKPQRNHRGHRGIHIYKKLHKVFEGVQSIAPCSLWLSFDNMVLKVRRNSYEIR